MKNHLEIESKHLKMIKQVLNEILPATAKVWAFGSRVTGKAKPYSDLDLVIDVGKPLSLAILAKLTYSFDESNLPYKVDIVDWFSINEEFRQHIKEQSVFIE